jgi:hypothetical protein
LRDELNKIFWPSQNFFFTPPNFFLTFFRSTQIGPGPGHWLGLGADFGGGLASWGQKKGKNFVKIIILTSGFWGPKTGEILATFERRGLESK